MAHRAREPSNTCATSCCMRERWSAAISAQFIHSAPRAAPTTGSGTPDSSCVSTSCSIVTGRSFAPQRGQRAASAGCGSAAFPCEGQVADTGSAPLDEGRARRCVSVPRGATVTSTPPTTESPHNSARHHGRRPGRIVAHLRAPAASSSASSSVRCRFGLPRRRRACESSPPRVDSPEARVEQDHPGRIYPPRSPRRAHAAWLEARALCRPRPAWSVIVARRVHVSPPT